ncbi:hypothetical protein [Spirosoma flavum]|uniref:Translational machinery protein n=1 Tax=Spirosoma flavum TaxID=2048557 RepID=A0ABW6AI44_9BACT
MKTERRIGIWLDHSTANLMEFTRDPIETKTIESAFTHEEKEASLRKSESLMQHKEQHQESAYYKKLGALIRGYDEVVLFGPTETKTELFNTLKDDHNFAAVKIDLQQTDKLTENQQHAFVKDYFSRH